jgi:hypothetical protein
MPDTRVLSNQNVTVLLGPDTAISDWNAPTLEELQSLLGISAALKFSGLKLNLKASSSGNSVSLTDAAGSETRTWDEFGGEVEAFTPQPTDQTSILRQTRNMIATPRTMLAAAIRTVVPNSQPIAPGDELNVYHVMTDQNMNNRSDTDYSYTINMLPQSDCGVNVIVPSSPATAVALTPSSTLSGTVGQIGYITALYEGVNVTIGAQYVSSNPAVATVDPHGIVQYLSAGTADITATYPGSAAMTSPLVVTVAA